MAYWKGTATRFVAFFDIMGFKEMVSRDSHDRVLDQMHSLRERLDKIEQLATPRLQTERATVRPVFFSDSILLISTDDTIDSAREMLFTSQWLMAESLSMGIPLKGSIACGMQTADFRRSIHFGRPLIDAYLLQEQLCLYGVAVHHSMESALAHHGMFGETGSNEYLHRYKAPMKSGCISHYLIDWTQSIQSGRDAQFLLSPLYHTVSGASRIYVDNTCDFAQSARKVSALQSNSSGSAAAST